VSDHRLEQNSVKPLLLWSSYKIITHNIYKGPNRLMHWMHDGASRMCGCKGSGADSTGHGEGVHVPPLLQLANSKQ